MLFKDIFEDAPRALARVSDIYMSESDLTESVEQVMAVEFEDSEGRPSRGCVPYLDYELEIGDEVEVAYLPYSDLFIEMADPLMLQLRTWLDGLGKRFIQSDFELPKNERLSYNVSLVHKDSLARKKTKWSKL